MKQLVMLLALLGAVSTAHAKKDCTTEPKSKWMSEADFTAKVVAEGYKVRKFKQSGNCYEIYGTNKDGKDVEIYFNPVDGKISKDKSKDKSK